MTLPSKAFRARVQSELSLRAQRMVAAYERTYGASGPGCCPAALAAALEELDITTHGGAAQNYTQELLTVINELRGESWEESAPDSGPSTTQEPNS